jgi:hypothetical protein
MTIPAAPPIQRHLLERRCSARGTTTVGAAALASGSMTAVADLDAGARNIGSVAGGIAMVLATGGAKAIVFSMPGRGWPERAAVRAATNASQLSHRLKGSLARPRMMTASTDGVSSALRELAGGGSRCTCAYMSPSTPSPSNGIAPVSIS